MASPCRPQRPATLLRRRDEGDRRRRLPGARPLAEQLGRERLPTVLTTRAGHAAISKYAHPQEMRRGPCPRPQLFQPRAPLRQPRYLQSSMLRHTSGAAGSHGLGPVWHSFVHQRAVTVRSTASSNGSRQHFRTKYISRSIPPLSPRLRQYK